MLPYKIITQTFGKKSKLISKDLSKDESYRIQVNKNKPVFEGTDVKGMIVDTTDIKIIKKVDDGLEITISRQRYNPFAVYCAFLKMAYSIMPLEFYELYVKHIVLLKQLVTKDSIYSDERKKEIMKSNPNCGLYCFFSGLDPLEGINVILWQKENLEEKSYPTMLFTLEVKNFSFTIPVLADTDQGTFKMPRFSSNKEGQYESLDFTKEEKGFKCTMIAKEIEIKDCEFLEEKLREQNLLKK